MACSHKVPCNHVHWNWDTQKHTCSHNACFRSKLFCCRRCSSKSSITRVTQHLSSQSTRSFGCPPLCFSISSSTTFLRFVTEDWLMPTKVATLQVETPTLSWIKARLFLRQQRHMATNDYTNYTSRTMEPRLHNAQEVSRHSQLRNVHKNVDVGRVTTNKSEYYKPNHFNISYSLFRFMCMQLITFNYLDSCFDHLITLFSYLNRLTMGAKVEFVYNVLNFLHEINYMVELLSHNLWI
jgi:hypothetical protein